MKSTLFIWPKSEPRAAGYLIWPYTLAVLVMGLFVAAALQTFRTWWLPPSVIDPNLELDCFSEPAIAVTVLKKHYQDLCAAYTAELLACPAENYHELQTKLAAWIARLETEREQQKDLLVEYAWEQHLLLLYKRSKRWVEFLDCYLDLIRLRPDHNLIPSWAPLALSQSRDYGRTEEVLAALRHLARFYPDPVQAGRIQRILKTWCNTNHSNDLNQVPCGGAHE